MKLLSLNLSAEVTIKNGDVTQIIWSDGTTPIAKDTILAKQVEI